ncbi:MAG TPA: ABC transporter permease [Gemmatimonadales bacterium]|jgi:predicted permease
MIDALLQDFRYGLRQLWRSPAFTATAVLTLALGIGATSAIFSVINGVLLRPLPYERPDRLAMINGHWALKDRAELSEAEFWDMREQARSFEGVAAYADGSVNLTGSGTPERLLMGVLTANGLPLLGVTPALGRPFTAEEDRPGQAPVVLLSDGLWRRRFGGDPKIIGRQVMLDDTPTTVIGVMPAGFQLPSHYSGRRMEAWAPLTLDPAADRGERGFHYLETIARLRDGTSLEMADREVSALMARMKETYAGKYAAEFAGSASGVPGVVTGSVKPAMLVLLGAVGLLLLIACANVAALLLVRSEERAREVALRTALGAGRGRLVRQLLTESTTLALVGGVLALMLATWGVRALVLVAPASIPRLDAIQLDGQVLAFTAAIALLTGLLFGMAPALHALRGNLSSVVSEGGRAGTVGRSRQRFRRALVVGQIALALMLLTGAGLLVRSFLRLTHVDPGFDAEHLLTARVDLTAARYAENKQIWGFFRDLIDRVSGLPGVQSAGAARALPMTGRLEIGDWSFVMEGRYSLPIKPEERRHADWQVVTPQYFRTMRIPLRQGRAFDDHDALGAPGALIVNETLARQVWPDGNALGQRVLMGGGDIDSIWRTVVGIVGDVKHRGLDATPRPEMYFPEAQWPAGTGTAWRSLYLVIRTSGDPEALSSPLRATLASIDPNVPLAEVQTMHDALGAWAAQRRLTMLIVTLFAGLALTLGAVGIYGVMAHLVLQRSREIGIRIALGAVPREILRMIAGQGAAIAGAGILLGSIGSFIAARWIAGMLYGVQPTDPLTFAGTAAALAAVAAIATLVPAVRATRVDPIDTLRSE